MKSVLFTFTLSVLMFSCNGQTENSLGNKDINKHEDRIMSENEMRITTDRAVRIIQSEDHVRLKKLLASRISRNVTDYQAKNLISQINTLFDKMGVPTGNENIIPSFGASINGADSIFLNFVDYYFEPQTENGTKFQQVLRFTFLQEIGPDSLIGIHLEANPFGQTNMNLDIQPLERLKININDISAFRIYFDEGLNRKTKFKNELGIFAIQGDKEKLVSSGLSSTFEPIFLELEKNTLPKETVFNGLLDRGDGANYIQVEFVFTNKPYTIFIYLQLDGNGNFEDEILIIQKQYANLGFLYKLKQSSYPQIVTEFSKIPDLDLKDYYELKP